MNGFAKFDEIPSMILQDIKETKRYGHTVGSSLGRTDNVKTVYPPTNIVCGGYNKMIISHFREISLQVLCNKMVQCISYLKQVAQRATIANLRTSKYF